MSVSRHSPSPLWGVALGLLLVALTPAATRAQEPGPTPAEEDWQPLETFGEAISVEVTEVEVWVTDREGRPVTGLSVDDFVLFEDGERVEITNFSSHEAEAASPDRATRLEAFRESSSETAPEAEPSADAAGTPAPAPDAPTAPATDPENLLHLAILIDSWNLRPADRARVFEDLRELLRERLRPDDRAMVLVHDRALALVQEPTADHDQLLAALARVERAATAAVSLGNERRTALQNIREAYENAFAIGEEIPDPCLSAWGEMQNHARSYATAVLSHTQRSGGALASAGGVLAGLPGRKVLLYVGSGLPQQAGSEIFHYLTELCPHQQSEVATWYSSFDLTWLYQEVARQANANGLTLYTVEASTPGGADDLSVGGLTGAVTPADGGTGGGGSGRVTGNRPQPINSAGKTFRPSAAARRTAELDQEAGLFYVANETGGRAILNAADFSTAFARLATELRTYYSLGFTPEHGGDGQLHRIEVKLAKGVGDGYRVRHRQSYRDTPYEQRMAQTIRGVAQFGTEANRMGMRVETGEATRTGDGFRVPIRLWVPLDEVTLVDDGGGGDARRAGRLRVLMAVSDAAGNLGPVRQKLVAVEVREDGGGGAGAGGRRGEHLVEVDLHLPTPTHVVALGLRDELGGETSFVRHEIRLADVSRPDGSR